MSEATIENTQSIGLTPGQLLRQVRESRAIIIEKVAKELRLSTQTLLDIEADNYQHMSALVYIQGHLKRYAKLLNIPEEKILAALDQMDLKIGRDPKERPLSAPTLPIYTKTKSRRGRFWGWFAAILILLIILMINIWWGDHKGEDNSTDIVLRPPVTSQVRPVRMITTTTKVVTNPKPVAKKIHIREAVEHKSVLKPVKVAVVHERPLNIQPKRHKVLASPKNNIKPDFTIVSNDNT